MHGMTEPSHRYDVVILKSWKQNDQRCQADSMLIAPDN